MLPMILASSSSSVDYTKNLAANHVILAFDIVMMVLSIVMIIIGLLQRMSTQNGLSALNGGNEELFNSSKQRGSDRTFSIWMMSLGIVFAIITIVICILTNTILK